MAPKPWSKGRGQFARAIRPIDQIGCRKKKTREDGAHHAGPAGDRRRRWRALLDRRCAKRPGDMVRSRPKHFGRWDVVWWCVGLTDWSLPVTYELVSSSALFCFGNKLKQLPKRERVDRGYIGTWSCQKDVQGFLFLTANLMCPATSWNRTKTLHVFSSRVVARKVLHLPAGKLK